MSEPDPSTAHYHTFAFSDAAKKLERHPPDWFDGNRKPCPGSGMAPGVQFHGDVGDDGEPRYLCRCPWCDRPHVPGPMPQHTFIPVRGAGSYAMGSVLEMIEERTVLLKCDGDHGSPRCLDPECWLSDPPDLI